MDNGIEEKTCMRCGLIQPFDILFGLMICDAQEAFFYGCPTKENILNIYPDFKYEEKSLESPWISVKDSLPPINVFVLVSVNDNRYQSIHLGCIEIFRDELEWFKADCSCCEFPGENVTHWMPLPKFPEITPE